MEAARITRISHHHIAERRHLASGIALSGVVLALLICAGAGLVSTAGAQTIGSNYTSTAPRDCRVSGAGNGVDDSTTRFCPGQAGLGVLVNEDDLPETVSVGRSRATASEEPAAQTWFGPFNSSNTTVEWQALDGKPFAIIQRWHLDDNADEDKNGRPAAKPMLVVTRLPPGPACHVADVDVKAKPDATRPQGRRPSRARLQMRERRGESDRRKRPGGRAGGTALIRPSASARSHA